MLYLRIHEYRVTERRDDSVYRTEYVRDWFVPMTGPFPKDRGDVRYCSSSDIRNYRRNEVPEGALLEEI